MLSKITKPILTVLLSTMLGQFASAQAKENPITTAVPFLRLTSDARVGGMGDASIAITPDVNSIFVNGAKTASNDKKYGIGLNYTPWLSELDLRDVYQLSLSSFYKLNDNEAISFGLRDFSMGTFNFTDNQGQQIKTYRPSDLAIEGGYSRKLTKKMSVGLSLRYIHSKLADNTGTGSGNYKSGSTVAADLSAFWAMKSGWNFGAALTNLGGKMNYGNTPSFIPANITIGTAYNKKIDNDNKISFALDISKLLVPTPPDPTDAAKFAAYENKGVVGSWFSSYGDAPGGFSEEIKEIQIALGTEYSFKDQFSFRAGYFGESKLKGDRNYFTIGGGVKYKATGFDVSYLIPSGNNSNTSALRNTLRLSLLFSFNNMMTSK